MSIEEKKYKDFLSNWRRTQPIESDIDHKAAAQSQQLSSSYRPYWVSGDVEPMTKGGTRHFAEVEDGTGRTYMDIKTWWNDHWVLEHNEKIIRWLDESRPIESERDENIGDKIVGNIINTQQAEIQRLKELLREVCVRANIIFPEREQDLDWFDEEFKGQIDLQINLSATLGLGEIDEQSKKDNEEALKKIQQQFCKTNNI